MLGPGQAQAEIARVQPGELVTQIPLPGRNKSRSFIELHAAVIPEDSPLNDPSIDVLVATKGSVYDELAGVERPYVIGRVAVEHTPGDEPAIVDVKAQALNEENVIGRALPRILQRARVRRARLSVDRANVKPDTISNAGFDKDSSGSFLIPAAA